MKLKLFTLFLLESIILLISIGTLTCHVVQLVLLSQIPNTGQWWPSYKPYTFYYVGSIVSILSSTTLILFFCIPLKSFWIHRIVATINLALTTAFAVYNTLESGVIPWTGAVTKSTTITSSPDNNHLKGFATYCDSYSDDEGLNTFLRCWMTNGTWLGMIIYGFFWLLLLLYLMVLKNSDLNEDDYDAYDYKNDVPMVDGPSSYLFDGDKSKIGLRQSADEPVQASSIQPSSAYQEEEETNSNKVLRA